jgi:hypothetical protein
MVDYPEIETLSRSSKASSATAMEEEIEEAENVEKWQLHLPLPKPSFDELPRA